MKLLIDKELVALVQSKKITEFVDPSDWYNKTSPVQPSSIDMHIGKIFVPEIDPDRRGGINNPKTDYHTLLSGETAFVETAEKLDVPPDIAGFGFPPASMAVKGILMTNPGHIDPGFKGNLTFTLINMGKEPFTIRHGDILFTTLWVKLSCDVEKDYSIRTGVLDTGAKEENVDVLSKDFLDVNNRAERKAKKALKSSIIWASSIAAAISVLGGGIQYALSTSSANNKRIEELTKTMAVLEVKLEERNSKQVAELKEDIDSIKSKIGLVKKEISEAESESDQ